MPRPRRSWLLESSSHPAAPHPEPAPKSGAQNIPIAFFLQYSKAEIVSNRRYAGETGFEIYDRIVADAPRVLRPGGWLILELGFGSRDYVANLLSGWQDVRIAPDLAGIPRVIAARRVGFIA